MDLHLFSFLDVLLVPDILSCLGLTGSLLLLPAPAGSFLTLPPFQSPRTTPLFFPLLFCLVFLLKFFERSIFPSNVRNLLLFCFDPLIFVALAIWILPFLPEAGVFFS